MKHLPIVLLAALVAVPAAQLRAPLSPAMTSLVETERAFARTSVTQGRRAAFLAFLGEDSVFFTPEPASAPKAIRALPATSSFNLDWEPRYGDVAAAGDLGYTTGPFIRSSPDGSGKVLATGWFFTVWKTQPGGAWKVLIDTGISSPPAGALRPSTFEMASPGLQAGTDADPEADAGRSRPSGRDTALLAVDRSLCASIVSDGLAEAVAAASHDGTRLYREGVPPMTGAAAIRAYLASKGATMRCEPVKDEASRSADLGYTYGKYSSGTESGYYLRVWKRMAGEWKLAFDLLIAGA